MNRYGRTTAGIGGAAIAIMVALGATSGTAAASPGDPLAGFGTQGRVVTDLAEAADTGPLVGDDDAYAVARAPDGKIVAAGSSGSEKDTVAVARYLPDGSLDPSFDGDGKARFSYIDVPGYGGAQGVAVQPDGKIVVGGYTRPSGPTDFDFAAARLNADGSLDPTFDGDGRVVTKVSSDDDYVASLLLQADGSIVLTGTGEEPGGDERLALVRYLPDGSLDPSFSGDGIVVEQELSRAPFLNGSAALQPDGRIVVAVGSGVVGKGKSRRDVWIAARYATDGTLDATFADQGVAYTEFDFLPHFDPVARDVAVAPNGRIVVAGELTRCFEGCFDEYTDVAVARYKPNGKLDRSFGDGGQVIAPRREGNDQVGAVAVDSRNRVITAGGNDVPDFNPDFELVRLKANGKPDKAFGKRGFVTTRFGNDFSFAHDVIAFGETVLAAGRVGQATSGGGEGDFGLAAYEG